MSIKARNVQRVLAGIVGALILGANLTAAPVKGKSDLRLPALGPALPLVFHTKDTKTGLDIRTTQTKLNEVIVEVKDANVAIWKKVGDGSSETTLTTKSGRVTMTLKGGEFTVKTRGGHVTGNLSDRASLLSVNTALAKSPASKSAKALLARLALNPDSVPGHALLLTRALLQSVEGDRTGADSLASWSRQEKGRGTVRRASLDEGPEYCWDTYAVSAMHIWDDYAGCYDDCSWYNYACKGECAFIYDLRAEGAFAWWLKCTALRT